MSRPRTQARQDKIMDVLNKRQPMLTVIFENVFDPHNISAMLRTCDAVGIMEVHVLNTNQPTVKKLGKRSSASARKWVKAHYYESLEECVLPLKEKGFKIFATHLSASSKSVYDFDFTQPTAFAFGNEHYGVSEGLLAHAENNFIIPMQGMIQSLNVSVACAASLYEAMRQRTKAGMYQNPQLPESEMQSMFEEWIER
ncbi:MAG: RNA methyltransferase [Bacteroidetes bacterium]|nr:RNA methyltransferase [Bacteroidota bacterium]